jgi:DNA (cytosine-5)-methyltransferase 1
MNDLTLGSLFDGSGGFPLGGMAAGITPIWSSEIEPFPIRVTTKRMPLVKHYGDVSMLNGAELEPVDIITFGSPCQDMSIAGKREGLDGSRSSLFYEAVRIVKEMREATHGRKPEFIVWENVPGAFSSNHGEDFRCVIESICRIKEDDVSVPRPDKWSNAGEVLGDGYSVAWRVLDAQYWGVPQRRKRIYLVADLGGSRAGKILFESEGLSGYSRKGQKARQEAAGDPRESSPDAGLCLNDQGGCRMDVTHGVVSTLRAESHHPPVTLYENHSQDSRYNGPLSTANAVTARYGTGGNNQPLVVATPKTLKIRSGCDGGGKGPLIQDNRSVTLATNNDQTLFQPVAYGISSDGSNAMRSPNPRSGVYRACTSRTLDTGGGSPACNQGGIAVVALEGNGTRPSHKGSGYSESGVGFTLNATEHHAVAFAEKSAALSANDGPKGPSSQQLRNPESNFVAVWHSSKSSFHTAFSNEGAVETLVATDYKDPPTVSREPEYIVRRLTPTECARLQGFPDWWCDDLGTDEPTDEEMAFWRDVFETHRRLVTHAKKPKTDSQIRKWLKDPHTDSAEYRMWGNGVALPCVIFVLSGISYFAGNCE